MKSIKFIYLNDRRFVMEPEHTSDCVDINIFFNRKWLSEKFELLTIVIVI